MSAADSSPATPHCPRCTYDLSGEVARWTDQCPTSGVCPECGLGFPWGGVLNPTRWHVVGFVEHTPGFFRTLMAAWRTWWWTHAPRAFWSRITLEAPIRPGRWFVWLLVIFLGGRFAASGLYAAAAYLEFSKQFAKPMDLLALLGDGVIETFFRGIADVTVVRSRSLPGVLGTGYTIDWRWNQIPAFLYWVPLLVFLPLVVLLLLPETRRIAKVRSGHVLRAWVYSLAWLAIPLLLDVLNALRVFTRCKTGALILDDWMPTPRSGPAWPIVITNYSVIIAAALLGPLALWLTLWWWNAIRSWRLARARRVMVSLVTIWALGVVVALWPAVEWALSR